jgi:Domain of unknown function (DUF4276)
VSFKIYIEGGGDGKALDGIFREGWRSFFERALGERPKPKVVRGGSRSDTIDKFLTAVKAPSQNVVPLLLVDSEGPVEGTVGLWRHLASGQESLKKAKSVTDSAFLMVQVMETWFLADRATLARFFGSGFKPEKLEGWPKLEEVPKEAVLQALEAATAECSRRYVKEKKRVAKLSFELLSRIDPQKVETACPHAKQLFERLRKP